MRSLKNTRTFVNFFSNSIIWRINHDLIMIMVSKGWIHKELGKIWRYIQNLIKLGNEYGEKLEKLILLERIDEFTEEKIT